MMKLLFVKGPPYITKDLQGYVSVGYLPSSAFLHILTPSGTAIIHSILRGRAKGIDRRGKKRLPL